MHGLDSLVASLCNTIPTMTPQSSKLMDGTSNSIKDSVEFLESKASDAWGGSVDGGKFAQAANLLKQLDALARDAVGGLRYIEQGYGRLYGVGWDRVFKAADLLLCNKCKPMSAQELEVSKKESKELTERLLERQIVPVATSERMPCEGDCDEKGRCWAMVGDYQILLIDHKWLNDPNWNERCKYWFPFHSFALPTPKNN